MPEAKQTRSASKPFNCLHGLHEVLGLLLVAFALAALPGSKFVWLIGSQTLRNTTKLLNLLEPWPRRINQVSTWSPLPLVSIVDLQATIEWELKLLLLVHVLLRGKHFWGAFGSIWPYTVLECSTILDYPTWMLIRNVKAICLIQHRLMLAAWLLMTYAACTLPLHIVQKGYASLSLERRNK